MIRIGSSKAAARKQQIISGDAIDLDRAFVTAVEMQAFEGRDQPLDLHVLGGRADQAPAT